MLSPNGILKGVLHGLRLLASLLGIVRGGLRSLTHHLLGLVPNLGTRFLLSVVALATGFLGSVTALSAALLRAVATLGPALLAAITNLGPALGWRFVRIPKPSLVSHDPVTPLYARGVLQGAPHFSSAHTVFYLLHIAPCGRTFGTSTPSSGT